MNRRLNAREALHAAARAKAILEDPLVIEAFENIERKLHTDWAYSLAGATELREHTWRQLQALELLKTQFGDWIRNGALAEVEKETTERMMREAKERMTDARQ